MTGLAPKPSTTVVTFTPIWAFIEPWVLASDQIASVTFHLDAPPSSRYPAAVPIAIYPNGTVGGIMVMDTALTRSLSPGSPSTDPATTDGSTARSSAPTDLAASLDGTASNVTSSNGTIVSEIPSATTISTTRTSPSLVDTALSSPKNLSGLSIRQTAALAIGCVVVGAAFAVLAACILARRKRRLGKSSAQTSYSKPSIATSSVDEKSSLTITKHIEHSPSHTTLETLPASPCLDDNLVAMFTQLNASIANYAQRYMSIDRSPQLSAKEVPTYQTVEDLLGPNSPVNCRRMVTLLHNDQTRAAGIRRIIAWSILQNINISGAPETTLLPPEISECMSSMTGMQGDMEGATPCLPVWSKQLLTRSA